MASFRSRPLYPMIGWRSGYEGFEDALKAYIIAKGDWPKSTQPD